MTARKGPASVWLLTEINTTMAQEIHIEDVWEDALDCGSVHKTLKSAKLFALQTVREAIEEYHDQVEKTKLKPTLSWIATSNLQIWDAKWEGGDKTDSYMFRIREMLAHDLR